MKSLYTALLLLLTAIIPLLTFANGTCSAATKTSVTITLYALTELSNKADPLRKSVHTAQDITPIQSVFATLVATTLEWSRMTPAPLHSEPPSSTSCRNLFMNIPIFEQSPVTANMHPRHAHVSMHAQNTHSYSDEEDNTSRTRATRSFMLLTERNDNLYTQPRYNRHTRRTLRAFARYMCNLSLRSR